jgi:hypothetical protein
MPVLSEGLVTLFDMMKIAEKSQFPILGPQGAIIMGSKHNKPQQYGQ